MNSHLQGKVAAAPCPLDAGSGTPCNHSFGWLDDPLLVVRCSHGITSRIGRDLATATTYLSLWDPPLDVRRRERPDRPRRRGPTTGQVLVVTSVMFTFISFWRTAAIVLCDLASTAYYIGGIVESQIGKAAPWFILAVMLFSYAVRSVYIESCAMFVRGGVYRIVKEAMGGGLARLAVSALLFDYILTGPISGVTAGQYIIGLLNDLLGLGPNSPLMAMQNWLSAAIAIAITLYFWRVNTKGIHESSDQALKIMGATTVMGVIMIVWCLVTMAVQPGEA